MERKSPRSAGDATQKRPHKDSGGVLKKKKRKRKRKARRQEKAGRLFPGASPEQTQGGADLGSAGTMEEGPESLQASQVESAKHAGKEGPVKESSKWRKDRENSNSQQPAGEERGSEGAGPSAETAKAAQQQSQKSTQPDAHEKVFGEHKPQVAGTNLSDGKNQECGKKMPGGPDGPAPSGHLWTRPSLPTKVTTRAFKRPQNLQEEPLADRVTVYFHAILSKDFKLNLEKDLVYLRAGEPLGTWNDVVKMEVTRCLGQHGYLVEGHLVTSRRTVAVPIPYKYIVYKASEEGYELCYEYIYKTDAAGHVNRCLCVKDALLTQQGEWHQYDDIIWRA
ncbi:hypothetical protein AAFF_G00101290 [Aldrovandia affinis]|uniref:Uncharacterized protein n=1 Tax=Aldrovandia affinis TaxID=143900 RepID=A0AAD7WCE0_9TELE|nr:hypothetical protein AAFF_G00101290 [Aldrovandia affinis]